MIERIVKNPLLTIVTVSLNERNRINITLDSIFRQTFNKYESVVIDGGSSDGTKELVETEYINKLSYFISEKDEGIYDAMNKGIEKSNGEYILFLNAGDYLISDNVLQEAFSFNLIEDIVIFNLIVRKNNNDTYVHSLWNSKINRKYSYYKSFPHPATLFKKELFIKYGLYNKQFKIVGDHEIEMRFMKHPENTIKQIPTTLSVFLLNGISSDIKNVQIIEKETLCARKLNYSRLERTIYEIQNTVENELSRLKKKVRKIINYIIPYEI